jgi:hypothetical protein
MADVWDNGPDDATLTSVLLVLANSADDNGGNCFPGNALIARRTRYSERTVIRAVVELERQGWITVLQRRGGRPKCGARKHELAEYHTQYMINVARLKGHEGVTLLQANSATATEETGTLKGCRSVTVSEQKRVTLTQETMTLTPEKGDIDDKPPHPLKGVSVTDPSGEPSGARVPPAPEQVRPVNSDTGEAMMAAVWLFEELAVPSDFGMRNLGAQAIRMQAVEWGGVKAAAERILKAAQRAKASGETRWRFWLTDQGYLEQQAQGGKVNGTNRPSVTKQRIDGARRKLAEIAVRRGLVDLAGGDGRVDEAVSVAGSGRVDRGVPGGL